MALGDVDALLGGYSRRCRSAPPGVAASTLGSTGARLWANYVEHVPGMTGMFNVVHKNNIPVLFRLSLSAKGRTLRLSPVADRWYPSRLELEYRAAGVSVAEAKWITADDVACCLLEVRNSSGNPTEIEVRWETETVGRSGVGLVSLGGFREIVPLANGRIIRGSYTGVPFRLYYRTRRLPGNRPVRPIVSIAPGRRARMLFACALLVEESGAAPSMERLLECTDPLSSHVEEYRHWFDEVPGFSCSDPWIERMYAYRAFLLRYCLCDPRWGRLQSPYLCEGRSNRGNPVETPHHRPWEFAFWDFSRPVWLSAGLQALEARWTGAAEAARGGITTLVQGLVAERASIEPGAARGVLLSGDTEGVLVPGALPVAVSADRVIPGSGSEINGLLQYSAGKMMEIDPRLEWLEIVVDGLELNVRDTLAVHDWDGDKLPTSFDHYSGMEYQPSYFCREGLNPGRSDAEFGHAPIERVDNAVFLHMNLTGLASCLHLLGRTAAAEEYRKEAARTAAAIRSKMWDQDRRFFLSLSDRDDSFRIPAYEPGGFYPFLSAIAGDGHVCAWESLRDTRKFATRLPLPTVSVDHPAYSPRAEWLGRRIKGPHGCMWNGPAWPFATSLVLASLARAARLTDGELANLWGTEFRRWTRLMFRDGCRMTPEVVEHYDPESGDPLSQEEHYFHSTYIDLIVSALAGFQVDCDDAVVLRPLRCGIAGRIEGLPYRDRSCDMEWDEDGESEVKERERT
jgi:hypothetical protein